MITGTTERPREVIDVASMTPTQAREVRPELRPFLVDPCTAILFGSIQRMHQDADYRSELYAKRRQRAAVAAEARMERPR